MGTRPLWPGLDAPPGLEAQRAAESMHQRAFGFVIAADLVLNPLLIVIGIGVLRRWRFMVVVGAAWCTGKCATAFVRAQLTSSVLDDQIRAIESAGDAAAVEGLGELGIVLFSAVRALIVIVIAVSLIAVAIAERKRRTRALAV